MPKGTMANFIVTCPAGISYGVVLFLVAFGLSLIMGLMGIVTVAHGALFMTGAYTGASSPSRRTVYFPACW